MSENTYPNLNSRQKMEKFENIYQDADLMKKVLLEEADEAELQEFEKRLSASPDLQKMYEELQKEGALQASWDEYKKYSSGQAYQSFLQKTGQTKTNRLKRKSLRMGWYAAAAMVVLAVGLSFYLLDETKISTEGVVSKTLIQPGSKQAQLALPDGSMIDVNKKKEVDIVVDGVRIEYKKGILSYQPTERNRQHTDTKDAVIAAESNELIIPRGGENTVVLADGTKVYLNAGSKLTYPVRFIGKQRMVKLEGEAYFDVVKDESHPFVVQTGLGDVTVLGTAFNVSAYAGASACYTTLVHGKVSFSAPNRKPVTLLPGEQAVVSSDGNIEKHTVDVEEYIGWMNGIYTFNNRSLEEIMKTFERWYDIQVYYESPALRDITYSGSLKRYGTINSFLDALELTGDLVYKINGRKVLIYNTMNEE